MDNVYKYELYEVAEKLMRYGRWMKEALDESNMAFGNWELDEFEEIAKSLRWCSDDMVEYVNGYRERMSDE